MPYTIRSHAEPNGTKHVEFWRSGHAGEEVFVTSFEVPARFDVLRHTVDGEQNRDGYIHLTHYDRDNLLSYVWDGFSDRIEVSHGGYAEPVFAYIAIDPDVVEEVVTTHYDDGDNHVRDTFHIFERHIMPEEFEEDDPSVACPECGADPDQVEQAAEVVNIVTAVVGNEIHADHKEWFPEDKYVLRCPIGHTWNVPEGVEVVL